MHLATVQRLCFCQFPQTFRFSRGLPQKYFKQSLHAGPLTLTFVCGLFIPREVVASNVFFFSVMRFLSLAACPYETKRSFRAQEFLQPVLTTQT